MRRSARVGTGLACACAAVLAAGCAGEPRDDRIRNSAVSAGARANDAFLGFQHWVMVFQVASIVAAVGFLVVFIRLSRRRGRAHPGLVLLVAFTALSVFEPLVNFSVFAAYSPEFWHPPSDWPYFSLNPTVGPWTNYIAYPYFFLFPGLLTTWAVMRWKRNSPPGSFVSRRPLLTVFIAAFAFGAVFDAVWEIVLIRMEVYVYTQVVGSLSTSAGTTWQFPIVYELPLMGLMMGMAAVLLWVGDDGMALPERVAQRRGSLTRHPLLAPATVAFGAVLACFAVVVASYWVIRVTDSARTPAVPWPYSDTKVYDPQDVYREAGEPGPYRG